MEVNIFTYLRTNKWTFVITISTTKYMFVPTISMNRKWLFAHTYVQIRDSFNKVWGKKQY